MKIIKIGLIGVSGYGATHLAGWLDQVKAKRAILAAAVVINPEEVPDTLATLAALGCRVFADSASMYREMAGSLDLISIPTGIGSHESLTAEALANGCNVLVEKPAAPDTGAIDRMIAAEKAASPLFVAVGFQHIYSHEVQAMKRFLLAGGLGRIERIGVIGLAGRGDDYYRRNRWTGKLRDAAGNEIFDSPANNAFAHYLNTALFFGGDAFDRMAEIDECRAKLYRAREIESFDSCEFELVTSAGIPIRGSFSHTVDRVTRQTIRVLGEKGMIEWDIDGAWRHYDRAGGLVVEHPLATKGTKIFSDMVDRCNGIETTICTLPMARSHTRCISEFHRSSPIETLSKDRFGRREADGVLVVPDFESRFRRDFEEWTKRKLREGTAAWCDGTDMTSSSSAAAFSASTSANITRWPDERC